MQSPWGPWIEFHCGWCLQSTLPRERLNPLFRTTRGQMFRWWQLWLEPIWSQWWCRRSSQSTFWRSFFVFFQAQSRFKSGLSWCFLINQTQEILAHSRCCLPIVKNLSCSDSTYGTRSSFAKTICSFCPCQTPPLCSQFTNGLRFASINLILYRCRLEPCAELLECGFQSWFHLTLRGPLGLMSLFVIAELLFWSKRVFGSRSFTWWLSCCGSTRTLWGGLLPHGGPSVFVKGCRCDFPELGRWLRWTPSSWSTARPAKL